MKCSNCGSTHAVLPNFCIPFKRYSKQAILEITTQANESSTEIVANSLDLEPKQLRRMINTVKKLANNILHISNVYPTKFKVSISQNLSLSEIIKALPNDIDELYFKEFKTIFLFIQLRRKIYIMFSKLSD